jgi:flagellar biosynthesis/type III secretory pathway M-ring protein FliF/YscJ
MKTIIAIGLAWLALAFLLAWAWHRFMVYEKRRRDQMQCAIDDLDAADDPPERDFVMERAKHEAQREDAEEARQERARERHEEIIREMNEMARLEKEEKK